MNRTQIIFVIVALILFFTTLTATTWALNKLQVSTYPKDAATIQQTVDVKELQPTIDGMTLQGGR